ncbi:MAG: FHA domain-containing protein [Nitrospirae bacterium]|nr:FHA domain-containing protein [Candidatus Manganitrophaceae bacterium]
MASVRIYLKDEFRWSYTLLDQEVYIGRSRENHVVLPHPEVSRHHALIRKEGRHYIVEDQSGRGLSVNDGNVAKVILKDKDILHVGVYRLIFASDIVVDNPSDTMTWEPTLDLPGASVTQLGNAKFELVVTAGPDEGKRVAIGNRILKVGRSSRSDFPVADKTVSNLHLELEAGLSGVHVRDMGSTNGTRVDGQKIQSLTVALGSEIQIGNTTLKLFMEEETTPVVPPSLGGLVGKSLNMQEVYKWIRKAAKGDVSILIQGETGCGKEVVAQEIHRLSDRSEGPLITIDCSAIPKDLIESELFGHEKGSFTGAIGKRKGAFELADGGTVFLDEIGELPLEMQPKLLRVLEEKQLKRIGGGERIKSDFRVVAATNRWLDQEVLTGNFRSDLYFRLNVVPISLPPLRERREDIPLLVNHFLKGKSVHVPQAVLDTLIEHPWPGNVRELRNVLERGVVLMEENTLSMDDLLFFGAGKKGGAPMPWAESEGASAAPVSLEEVEQQVIRRALKTHEGDKKAVAKELGIALSTLYEKIRRFKLD